MADININHKVDVSVSELGELGRVIQSLEGHFEGLTSQLSGILSKGGSDGTSTNIGTNGKSANIELKADKVTAKLDEVVRALRDAASSIARGANGQGGTDDKIRLERERSAIREDYARKMADLRSQERQNAEKDRRDRSFYNVGRGMMMSAGMGIAYQAGSYGAVSGSQSGSVNAGVMNYNQFMQDYYNKQQDLKQNTITMGSMGLAGAAFMVNPLLGLAATGIAAGVNYYTNQNTEENKQGNQFAMNQGFEAWRLNQSGLGGAQSKYALQSGYGNIPLSQLQNDSLRGDYAGYATTISSTTLGGKRDVMSGMSERDKLDYNRKLTLASMLMGADMNSLNKNASVLSSITGKEPNKVLDEILYTNQRYGGDTASNTAKLVNLLETTHMGFDQANNLVNKYQYNDAMFNNQVLQQTASPWQLYQKSILMQLAGASPDEIRNGKYNAKHMSEYYADQQNGRNRRMPSIRSYLMQMSMGVTGENIMAQDVGTVNPSTGKPNGITENANMKQMQDWVNQSLSNIVVDSQNVNVTGNVYINGKVTDNGRPTDWTTFRNGRTPTSNATSTAQLPDTGVAKKVYKLTSDVADMFYVHHHKK